MKKCTKCGKTNDDSWSVCISCRNSLIEDNSQDGVKQISKNEQANNDIQREIVANIERKKEPFFLIKWALVTWALLWRTVLLPYLGLYAFCMVLVYTFALLEIKDLSCVKTKLSF